MVYSDKLSAYYLELAQSPSSETRFSGEDVRFSGEYEALENELSKAHSIHGHSQPDWQKIVEKSDALLRHESKDLRVAVWLTWALYQRESFPGLLAGLGLLRYLCEHHWAVVYPRKPRTRCAAFTWLVPRIEQVFTQSLSLKDQRPLFECMLEHLSRLDQLWSELLGDEAPLLLPIRRQLADRLQQVAESNPRPGGGSGVITQIKQVTTQLLSPEHVVDNEKDAHKLLRVLQDNARPLCAWWLRQNATDLRALRLSRTLTWLAIGTLPECDHEYVTPLRGPAPDKLKRYQERFQQGCHADLLPELEASLTLAPFWFDGLRMVWECLQGLQAHLAMIEMEVCFALLLQRLPGLAQLRFHDGTPFADPVTRSWINTQVTRHLDTPVPKVALDTQATPWEKALQDVTPLLRKDGLKAAVRAFKPGLQAASLDGRSLPMSRALLDQWGKAQVIRRGFFADDRGPPHVRFTLAPYSLDSAVSRAIFRFGGQQMEYRHGPIVPMAFQWPTETEDGRSSLVLERGVERPLGIEKNTGLWSLFRLFDLMQSEPLSGRDVRVLKADLGGLHANYLLTSQSTSSPFDLAAWRTFRIPEQL